MTARIKTQLERYTSRTAMFSVLTMVALAAPANAQLCGDCNDDGVISILDSLEAAQIDQGLIQPTLDHRLTCDVDADGVIDNDDAQDIAGWAVGNPVQLTCPNPCPMGLISECADAVNGSGIRDDNCQWWECDAGVCLSQDIVFADMGGSNGACPVDQAVDANDRFHALNCFANTTTLGTPGYTCEDAPPTAFNVDAGGAFGNCCSDGVCDGNDAFHALNAFAGLNLCVCPLNSGGAGGPHSCPGPTGPTPDAPVEAPMISEYTTVSLQATSKRVRQGDVVEVDVFLDSPLDDLRGYQLHIDIDGGTRGNLELLDIVVLERDDEVFDGLNVWSSFNVLNGQVLVGMDQVGVATLGGDYLATFTFRASHDAVGSFSVDLRVDQSAADRTFLFATDQASKIQIENTTPAIVHVVEAGKRRTR